MSVNTASGVKISIGAANSDRNTLLAVYTADTYVAIGEVEDLGEFGDTSATINFTALSDGRVRKFKGPRDAGVLNVVVGDDIGDVGQIAMEAAEATHFDYNFKVELNDALTLAGNNSTHYFIGKVMSKKRTVGNASAIVKRTFMVDVNSKITDTVPT